ncbi:MAG: hypothetical protein E7651_05900 [Ruminococcaceae bacterium]|nr:hypothetical protein [Oscillospiraceae bacterium]
MSNIFRRCGILLLTLLVLLSSWGCDSPQPLTSLEITNCDRTELLVGATFQLQTNAPEDVRPLLSWDSSGSCLTVDPNGLVTALSLGSSAVTVRYGDLSATVLIKVVEELSIDHSGVDEAARDAFYGESDPADSYEEALRRSAKGELSGAETVPDQAPELSTYRPMKDGAYIRNNTPYYADSNTYVVVNAFGLEVFRVYRGGGYITLEEVAAYVYAFGDVPANYTESKRTEPEDSIWGENLRLNHTKFSGNTEKYPYEPELPDISGCGGNLYYYELDIGTTGTDCDPAYPVKLYNDGKTITRGAARIVYTRYDANKNEIIDPNEKYLFYTYNHYNDFTEYLNYFGGWGETFGNITGGGTLSSKTDFAPTPYVPVVMMSLLTKTQVVFYLDPRKSLFFL